MQAKLDTHAPKFAALDAKHAASAEATKKRQQDELSKIHVRVRDTVQRKDEAIAQLEEDVRTARMRSEHAEQLLERQRTELYS